MDIQGNIQGNIQGKYEDVSGNLAQRFPNYFVCQLPSFLRDMSYVILLASQAVFRKSTLKVWDVLLQGLPEPCRTPGPVPAAGSPVMFCFGRQQPPAPLSSDLS